VVDEVSSVVNDEIDVVTLSMIVVEVGMDAVGLSVDTAVMDDEIVWLDTVKTLVELGISVDVVIDIGVVNVSVWVDGADSVAPVEATVSVEG